MMSSPTSSGTRALSPRAAALRTRTRTAQTADITFYNLLGGVIARVFDVAETASPRPGNGSLKLLKAKPGNGGLKLLEAVSNLIGDEGIVPEGGGIDDEDEGRRHRRHHVLQTAGGGNHAGV